ncbi:hypothetical protein FSP39_001695 [Pinctada imbricata]|uniref:pyridoxal 5'-phosphate synthase n=1 Tax=Pinctada imbricata TaxID=66713 RepID=A0AA88YMT6_PINIB|nr:hypothetical protein FSP39_001695 [Pinctada imbricata]
MRTPYRSSADIFDINDLASKDPYEQFQSWFDEACHTPNIGEANAMAIATATKEGIPSVRMVLMKGFDHNGFKFFTNYESRKAKEIEENPHCSIMFYWDPLKRSVRIEGSIAKMPEEESMKYFKSRPVPSRLGAICSHQSTVIPNREVLNKTYEDLLEEYKDEGKPIPKPDYWGGYLIKPTSFEFWQGQTNRLHDRLKFRRLQDGETIDPTVSHKTDKEWIIERLSP